MARPVRGKVLVEATPSESSSRPSQDALVQHLFEPETQEGERQKRQPKHYADESLESEDESSSFQPVPRAPPAAANKVQRRSDSVRRGSRDDHSYDHSSNETHDGPKLRSQPNVGTEPFQPGDHTSPRTKRRREALLNHPQTVESQPVGTSYEARAALANGSPSLDAAQQGPSFAIHLNNETQVVGPETQAAHARMEAEAASRLKRKRGASATAPDLGPVDGPPRPNENANPSSSEGSSERPTARSTVEGSTVAVSRRLVPSPQRGKAPTEQGSSPVPAPKRPRVDNSTLESSSPDPSIDAQALVGRNPIDGGPLQSTCPPPAAAGARPATTKKRAVQQTPSSWDSSSRPTDLPDQGSNDRSKVVAAAVPMQEDRPLREEEESGDEDDGMLGVWPRPSTSALSRGRTTPRREFGRRNVSPRRPSPRTEPSPRKNPFHISAIDDEPSGESSGAKAVVEEEVDELESQATPRPTAPSPSRPAEVVVQPASQQAGEALDQLLDDTPDEPPVPSRTDIGSSLGRMTKRAPTPTEDINETAAGSRPRLGEIAGAGSSQDGDTIVFEPTQPETPFLSNPYGTGVHAELPRLVSNPPSSSVEAANAYLKGRSGGNTTSLDPSGQKLPPHHLRRPHEPSPASMPPPPVQSSGSRRTVIPDSVQHSSSARSTGPADSSKSNERAKGKGRAQDDPSYVDETVLSDDANKTLDQSTTRRLPAIEEVPFVETNYDDPPQVPSRRHQAPSSKPGRREEVGPSNEDDVPLAANEDLRQRPRSSRVVSEDRPVHVAKRPLPPSRSPTPPPPPPVPPVTADQPQQQEGKRRGKGKEKAKEKPVRPLKVTKKAVPRVIVPPVPVSVSKGKRARKATPKAQEAAAVAMASGKGKARATRREEVVAEIKVVTSSPLSSVGKEGGDMEVDEEEEGPEELAVPAVASRAVSSTTAEPEPDPPLRRILALWAQDGAWYPGRIVAVQNDGVEVEFDDFDRRTVPIASIRRCEFRRGDLVRYVGDEPETQVAPAKEEARRRSRGPLQNPVRQVVRVYRLVGEGEEEEEMEVGEGEEQERDDVVVVCDVGADPDGEGTRFSEYQIEALSIPKPAKGQFTGREPTKAQTEALERSMTQRLGVGRRASTVVSASRHPSLMGESAPPVVVKKGDAKKKKAGSGSKILAGLGFLFTHTSSKAEVERMGGTALEVDDLFESSEVEEDDGSSSVTTRFRKEGIAAGLDGVFLVSDKPVTTLKYLMALALGVPIVSDKWIGACIDQKQVVDWIPFAHPAGLSAYLHGWAVGFQALSMSRDRHDLDSIERSYPRLRLLAGISVVCVCAKGDEGEAFAKHATSLISAMGASRIESTTSLQTYDPTDLSSFDFAVVQKPKSKVHLPRGLAQGPTLVDFDFVKQSLVFGRLLQPKFWCGEVEGLMRRMHAT